MPCLKIEIVGRRHRAEDVEQMPGDGDFADRVSALAVLDPEAGSAAAVIAGHHAGAAADQVGDIEAILDVGDQFVRRGGARLEVQIGCAGRRRRRYAALSMTGGGQAEFARGAAVEQPGHQHAVIDQSEFFAGDAFAVERMRAQAAHAQRVVDDANAVGE